MKIQSSFLIPRMLLTLLLVASFVGCQPHHSQYRDIHAAARDGDVAGVTLDLAQSSANLELPDDAGFTPLYLAASYCQTNVMVLLLDKGAKPDKKAKDGSTPLQIAAQQDCPEAVILLINRGATVNLRNHKGQTALGCAQAWHKDSMVELLRQHGGTE